MAQRDTSLSSFSDLDIRLVRNSPAFVKPGTSPYVLTLYQTHHGSHEAALKYQLTSSKSDAKHAVIRVSWINFICNSYVLGEEDVRTSKCLQPLPDICSLCYDELVSIQYCDGSVFPGRGPNAFPCNRNAVCVECRKTATYRQSDTWFCLECLETPTTFEGIYGNQICPSRDDPLCKDVTRVLPAVKGEPRSRVLVYVRPLGAPVLEKGTHHNPSQDYEDFVATNAAKQNVGWVAERKKEASSRLLDMFAEAALSSGQQAIITSGLRKMQNDKIVHIVNDVQIFG
jgi:hypothetical protein